MSSEFFFLLHETFSLLYFKFLETVLPSMDEASGTLADDPNVSVTRK